MRLTSRKQYEEFRVRATRRLEGMRCRVLVCTGSGCLAGGAREVAEAVEEGLRERGLLDGRQGVEGKRTGCHGLCEAGPLVSIEPEGILYTRVTPDDVPEILDRTVLGGEVVERLAYEDPRSKNRVVHYRDIPFYKYQTRIATRNVGRVDPHDLEDAIAHGAYAGAVKALFEMTPEQVIDEVARSGLRGRGGAGFHTGRKWAACRRAPGDVKYVICNGDEGDPGAFKDRAIMEGDPHSVLEGMIIGAYAVGAREGFIYVRDEYPPGVLTSLHAALEAAREAGILGRGIFGTGMEFDIRITRGGGAYVCGESSALMRSIEGKVGEPRAKYIHGTERGLYDRPTVLNNVETWAHVGAILTRGGEWFAGMGTPKSKGTKAFSLSGKVRNAGLIELPMGTPLRHILHDIGGGIRGDRPFKAVQTGGPSGGVIPEALLDLPVDYEQLTEHGSMMGSGGMIVMDDRTCMVDVARYFVRFLNEESCGKCVPCREGLLQMLHLLDGLCEGRGRPGDLDRIERLARGMKWGSLCDLGRSAPNPVLSTLRHFREEYEAHLRDGACPAGVCRALTQYEIVPERCDGCHECVEVCPTAAIAGKPKQRHVIDQEKCIACGECFNVCPVDAIRYGPKARPATASAGATT